jgi:hypothetical protein
VRASCLRAARCMLRLPPMANAWRYVLWRDAGADLARLTDSGAVATAALLAGGCQLTGGVGAGYTLDAVFVQFLKDGECNFGDVAIGTVGFNGPGGAGGSKPAARWLRPWRRMTGRR